MSKDITIEEVVKAINVIADANKLYQTIDKYIKKNPDSEFAKYFGELWRDDHIDYAWDKMHTGFYRLIFAFVKQNETAEEKELNAEVSEKIRELKNLIIK